MGSRKKNRPPGEGAGGRMGEGRGGEVFRDPFAPPLWPQKLENALTGNALPPSDVLMYASDASKTPQDPSETPPGLLQDA